MSIRTQKMLEASISVTKVEAEVLGELTGTNDLHEAIIRAIRFTLMHDKDSVQEALKS